MARGNQRDKAREANQKKMASQVRCSLSVSSLPVLGPAIGPSFLATWSEKLTSETSLGRL